MPALARRTVLTTLVAILPQVLALPGADASPVRVLILTGLNNHNWKETTPVLTSILGNSGRFAVTVIEKPETCTAALLAGHDALLSNWNNFGSKAGVGDWPESVRTAFVDYVRNGGGIVVVHAGGTMFGEWTEFQQIIGATWGKGTGHGPMHEFEVRLAADHPITEGLTSFHTTDELWHRMAVTGEPTALATAFSAEEKRGSGQDEPVARITRFGKGRCFNLTLGHNAAAMQSPGFRALLLRGAEWAATGKVTIAASTLPETTDIERMLRDVSQYSFGDTRAALVSIERLVFASSTNADLGAMLATNLAAMLSSDASVDCKAFVCKQLSILGTAATVPALAAQLADADLAVHSRAALERIPDNAATDALRAALVNASGAARVGLINSLGKRGDTKALAALTKLATNTDMQTAGAALDALGAIGGNDALAALSAVPQTSNALHGRHGAALLLCAKGLIRDGKTEAGARVLAELIKPDQTRHIRLAAFPAHVTMLGSRGGDAVLTALTGDDPDLQRAAVRALRTAFPPKLAQAIAGHLSTLSPVLQEQVIALLGDRGDPAGLSAIEKASTSSQPGVQRAATVALGKLGNAQMVAVLARLSTNADGDTKRSIVAALSRLRGDDVNVAIVAASKAAPEDVRCDLIKSLSARHAQETAPALVEFAGDKSQATRAEALKALGVLGNAGTCGELIAMLAEAKASDRPRIEGALVSICRREATLAPLLSRITDSQGPQKASLLAAIGTFGGDEALTVLQDATRSTEADVRISAIRELSDWEDARPLDALLSAATESDDLRVCVLASRGIAALAQKATKRSPGELADTLGRAIAAAPRTEEKRALLGALHAVRSRKALDVALVHLANRELVNEAAAAVVGVAETVGARAPLEANAALEHVIAHCPDPVVAAKATSLLGLSALSDNLAIGGKATSPDGLEKDGAAHGDQAAIDGDPATYWDEENGKKLYRLRVEMIDEAKVTSIRILGYVQHGYSPRDFQVLCDGEMVKNVTNAQYTDRLLLVPIPPTLCRTVELAITGYYTHSPAIRELEIYGETEKPATPQPKPTGIADGLYQTDRSLAYARGGTTLWRLNTDPKEGKPYMHPLRLPNGDVLTALRPADHVWHRALWFSWKFINGVNYWEENKKTGLSDGRTTLASSTATAAEDGSATSDSQLEYHPPDGPVVLRETRSITISPPEADGSYRIDWAATFAAGNTEVKLSRTPLPPDPGGAKHGGYAGFSARLGRTITGGVFVNSEGGRGQKGTHGTSARWVDYSGAEGGIAILDHPENARHPAPWYVAEEMPYFSPAFLFRDSMTLAPGQEMTLRYRVLVHGKPMDADRLNSEWEQFVEN
ncbi:MAG: hypothetical protein HN742_40140 [Lentisphaerae bacterium]|jgi:uncharacterized protein|nr:hypothetical protein [Lentisphaerota bacterium]MBT5605111.1 hypothetical protein [Lentisphaerota bacterium]MBT7055993.1 hypothetical protein [Lentisphaerota bacterium]MBT7848146.1 hypothetical protein [Lentisphaerota bacterium]